MLRQHLLKTVSILPNIIMYAFPPKVSQYNNPVYIAKQISKFVTVDEAWRDTIENYYFDYIFKEWGLEHYKDKIICEFVELGYLFGVVKCIELGANVNSGSSLRNCCENGYDDILNIILQRVLSFKIVPAVKKTCDFYLKINDDCHPNINPPNIKIHECIENIKKHIQYSSIDIDVLNEIDKLCLQ